MKVTRLKTPGVWESYETKDLKSDQLKSHEALVRVQKMGVCGTDLHAFKGDQPFFEYPKVLGHELSVEVIAIGDGVSNVTIGDQCSVEPYYNEKLSQPVINGKPNCGEYLKVFGCSCGWWNAKKHDFTCQTFTSLQYS